MSLPALSVPLHLRLPKAAATKFRQAGFETVNDLLTYAPCRYYQWGKLTDLLSLVEGEESTVLVNVSNTILLRNRNGGYRLVVSVTDGQSNLVCTFFAKNPYMLSHHQRILKHEATVLASGKVSRYRGQLQFVQPQFEEVEQGSEEDIARRAGRPIPIYRSIAQLPSWKIRTLVGTLLDELDDVDVPEIIDKDLRVKHALMGHAQALRMLHRPNVHVDWQQAKRSLAWQEALVLQTALLVDKMNCEKKAPPFMKMGENNGTQNGTVNHFEVNQVEKLIQGLPFELTEAQKVAWKQIGIALGENVPMQRLLQADVGAGKTVIALIAMVHAVQSGYQTALLAPTEILARQHHISLTKMLNDADVAIPTFLLTSKQPAVEKNQVLTELGLGTPGIVVGTHALIQEGVHIPNLGLLVVDEQHRFGVLQRERLRQGRELAPHLLVMTATPIPRTIAMTVFGDLDVTEMRELPPGRQRVETFLVDERNKMWMDRLWERCREEVDAGGRVYVVCPRIDPGDETNQGDNMVPSVLKWQNYLKNHVALHGIKIGIAHGRQTSEKNAEAFAQFADGSAPILVATTVIEVGVDVPEATMIVILGGNRFGMSQLHQLRGRVGRSNRASVCIITHPGNQADTTLERLEVVSRTSSGFELAEADLRLRKEGDVLGKNQSGHVSSLKFLSVRDNASIIALARETATTILIEDPKLVSHRGLAEQVADRAGEQLVWLERN